jgi:hypothetical protein
VQASTIEGLFDAASSTPSQPHLAVNSTDVVANDVGGMKGESGEGTRTTNEDGTATDGALKLEASTLGAEIISGNPYQPAAVLGEEQAALPVLVEQGLKTTRAGLLTCYYGICLVLLALIGGFVIALVMQGNSMLSMGLVLAALAGLCSFVGGILVLVGQVVCLAVPVASGCRWHLKLVLSMHVMWLVFAFGVPIFVEAIGPLGGMDLLAGEIFTILNLLPEVVGLVLFLIFLKRLALYLGDLDLVSAASSVMWWVIGLAILFLVFPPIVFVVAMSGLFGAWLFVPALLVTALVTLITFIRFAKLIVRVAHAIPKEGT